jgi:hypothetical protein
MTEFTPPPDNYHAQNETYTDFKPCLDITSDTLGVQCEPCPTNCHALAAGQLLAEQTLQIGQLETDKLQLMQDTRTLATRLDVSRRDRLVRTAYTKEGLDDLLKNDAELRGELLQGNWGTLCVDVRFAGVVNQLGIEYGDGLIIVSNQEVHVAVNEVTEQIRGNLRSVDRKVINLEEDEEWQHILLHPRKHDVVNRKGGDEYLIIVRDVNPDQLGIVCERIQGLFSVSTAIERYAHGRPPFVASVGSAHFSELEEKPDPTDGDLWATAMQLNTIADKRQVAMKKEQYILMADMAGLSEDEIEALNTKMISEAWLTRFCPDFLEDPTDYFELPSYD